MTNALVQHTYAPEEARTSWATVAGFLALHTSDQHKNPLRLVTSDGAGVTLPEELPPIIAHIVSALEAGRAVTVSPRSRMVTTQEAADLLGLSRPTVVKLIDSGAIPSDRTGHRRKVAVEDVVTYQQQRRDEQYAALAAIAVDPFDDDEDLADTLAELKRVRKDVAERRRQGKVTS